MFIYSSHMIALIPTHLNLRDEWREETERTFGRVAFRWYLDNDVESAVRDAIKDGASHVAVLDDSIQIGSSDDFQPIADAMLKSTSKTCFLIMDCLRDWMPCFSIVTPGHVLKYGGWMPKEVHDKTRSWPFPKRGVNGSLVLQRIYRSDPDHVSAHQMRTFLRVDTRPSNIWPIVKEMQFPYPIIEVAMERNTQSCYNEAHELPVPEISTSNCKQSCADWLVVSRFPVKSDYSFHDLTNSTDQLFMHSAWPPASVWDKGLRHMQGQLVWFMGEGSACDFCVSMHALQACADDTPILLHCMGSTTVIYSHQKPWRPFDLEALEVAAIKKGMWYLGLPNLFETMLLCVAGLAVQVMSMKGTFLLLVSMLVNTLAFTWCHERDAPMVILASMWYKFKHDAWLVSRFCPFVRMRVEEEEDRGIMLWVGTQLLVNLLV